MPHRQDDASVPANAVLWRGIIPDWVQPLPDGSTRPQSLAFIDGSETQEVSYFIASETTRERVMHNRPFVALAQVEAQLLRELGYSIVRDPDGAGGEQSHVVACPAGGKTRKEIARDARKIAKAACWAR